MREKQRRWRRRYVEGGKRERYQRERKEAGKEEISIRIEEENITGK